MNVMCTYIYRWWSVDFSLKVWKLWYDTCIIYSTCPGGEIDLRRLTVSRKRRLTTIHKTSSRTVHHYSVVRYLGKSIFLFYLFFPPSIRRCVLRSYYLILDNVFFFFMFLCNIIYRILVLINIQLKIRLVYHVPYTGEHVHGDSRPFYYIMFGALTRLFILMIERRMHENNMRWEAIL